MNRKLGIAMFVSLCLAFTGLCAASAQSKAKAPAGKALWDTLKKEDYAKKWAMWPKTTALHKGVEPHGVLLTTYVNGPALKAINARQGKLPYDSVLVTENYGPDKKLLFYSVMVKVKGYNPGEGDWFWVQYGPDGSVDMEGKIDECIQCHKAQKSNDYVYTSKLK